MQKLPARFYTFLQRLAPAASSLWHSLYILSPFIAVATVILTKNAFLVNPFRKRDNHLLLFSSYPWICSSFCFSSVSIVWSSASASALF